MKYRFQLGLLILLLGLSFTAPNVLAHEMAQDESINVEMHIDPGDAPIAGTQNIFEFEISDSNNNFNLGSCNCVVSIYKDGKEIQSISLSKNEADLQFKYIFPNEGNYIIKLTGRPEQGNLYKPFMVSYPVAVNREVKSIPSNMIFPCAACIFLALVVIVGLLLLHRRNK